MIAVDDLRRWALALPETTEKPHARLVGFRVADVGFARVDEHRGVALLDVDPSRDRSEAGLRPLTKGSTEVDLSVADPRLTEQLVAEAWRFRAPAAVADAHPYVGAPPGGALPKAIGRAATGALHAAGLTTLDAVRAADLDAVLRLHGVGPKAVRILRELLA
ncbi:helix-hairpin-helix domain-containing protein [Cellulomonas fengjieae]|uniref:helix-hairpin-helix domain-containing protein n=1 Tax=Cellulomonas fengjieae TaxID=2819978 RepID=UPI001AAEE8FA|nr:helix-hairpin-helix domain-containing protein [Cellulomonas fengjieae]MBO3102368.1 helix-hairpin-helix domain-containing protein [Cellulomonas fengjieae]